MQFRFERPWLTDRRDTPPQQCFKESVPIRSVGMQRDMVTSTQTLREKTSSSRAPMTISIPMGVAQSPTQRTNPLWHPTWPSAMIGFGLALSAAWTSFLGYMLVIAIMRITF